jgi:hypothetical protein
MRTAGFARIEPVITMAALDFPILKMPYPDAQAFEGPQTVFGADIGSLQGGQRSPAPVQWRIFLKKPGPPPGSLWFFLR